MHVHQKEDLVQWQSAFVVKASSRDKGSACPSTCKTLLPQLGGGPRTRKLEALPPDMPPA